LTRFYPPQGNLTLAAWVSSDSGVYSGEGAGITGATGHGREVAPAGWNKPTSRSPRVPRSEQASAWIETYRATVKPLYGFVARRAGRSRQLAEDITQETYLRALATWTDGRQPDNALAWLKTVARNLLINHYRARDLASLDAVDGGVELTAEPVDSPDAAELLFWGLARLGNRQRKLLEAFHFDGQSTRELAKTLGLSERAVEGRLRRARRALKAHLAPMMND
jgi:RNA polymerase sigma-70 factor (ECF subfamily)